MKLLLSILLCFFIVVLHAQSDSVAPGKVFTSFDGTNIYYEVSGEGKPVVLVHGFIVNSESWKRTALYRELNEQGFQVIILDQRGNGKSDKPHQPEAYENDAEAKDIMALAKSLGLKQYSAVGYSRGAIIVSRLLVLDKNINKAVIGGMGADFTNPEWPRRIMFYKALMGEPVEELQGVVKLVQDRGLDQLALAYMQRSQPSTSEKELGQIKKPVLVICGTEDEANGSSKQLAEMIPKSEYVRTPGDHNNAAGTPEFSAAVIRFLKQK
jgi:pimeloyl-ACP methyl ester carboxylesterase